MKPSPLWEVAWLHLGLNGKICLHLSACEFLTWPNIKTKPFLLQKEFGVCDKHHTMDTFGEIIPFAKEMLTQRPSLSMLKLYMLGSTLVVLGVVGGLVETVLLPFGEQETVEDAPGELIMEKNETEKKPYMTVVSPEEDDVYETELMEAKAKHLVMGRRRSSIRLLGS
ncbi:hypothetical protein CesoFtcFv8_011772 [Champsocephalus esox]|uniref:Uncharacterized protein n=2 Tax=Champsocephalus TaxID=52236 RepID=A0AAN8DKY2_CHAGU|nr:hypothetical protein CesoFtcFv8_011772 [Champsocephalus esox]KAK5924164.1 hypothetical protein CgunFtcFv8_001063 [Champsocephalus gunnari]